MSIPSMIKSELSSVMTSAATDAKSGTNIKHGGKNAKSEDSVYCADYMFKECCTMPKLIPRETFEKCVKEMGGAKYINMLKARATGTRSKRDTNEKKKGPMCMMECVMKAEKMLTSTGELDAKAIKEEFLNNTDGVTWSKELVTRVTDKCVADVKALSPDKLKTDTNCPPTSGFFMTCVRVQLTLDCPAGAKAADYTTNKKKNCVGNLQGLKACDPYVIPPPNEKDKKRGKNKKTNKNSAGKAKKSGQKNPPAKKP